MDAVERHVMQGGTGLALELAAGQYLRVTDLEGGQVVDMAVFSAANPREMLSLPYTRARYAADEGSTFYPGDRVVAGDVLRSTLYSPMLRIVEESAEIKGVHGVDGRMCNRHLYAAYGEPNKDGCQEIIANLIASYGLGPEEVPDCFDIFMNYRHDCAQGRWVIGEGVTRPGDWILFRAKMDVIVALSNCPYFPGTPVSAEVIADAPEPAG